MFNIRNKLIQITQGGTFQLPTGIGYLESWVYHVVQSVINVNEGFIEEHGMADLFQQLIVQMLTNFVVGMLAKTTRNHYMLINTLGNNLLKVHVITGISEPSRDNQTNFYYYC